MLAYSTYVRCKQGFTGALQAVQLWAESLHNIFFTLRQFYLLTIKINSIGLCYGWVQQDIFISDLSSRPVPSDRWPALRSLPHGSNTLNKWSMSSWKNATFGSGSVTFLYNNAVFEAPKNYFLFYFSSRVRQLSSSWAERLTG